MKPKDKRIRRKRISGTQNTHTLAVAGLVRQNVFVTEVNRVTVHYADLRIIAGRETSSSFETHMFVYCADCIVHMNNYLNRSASKLKHI